MKKVFKSMSVVILVALVVSILPVKLQVAAAKKPTLSGKKISVNIGQSKTISVKSNGKKITSVKWRSGDNKIAKVSKKNTLSAKIKGISEGKTVITATVKVKGKSYKLTANVTVKNDKKKTEESENEKSELDNEASANAQDEQAGNETDNTVIPAESSPFSDEEIRQAAKELMVKQYALSTGSYEEFAKYFYDSSEEDIKSCQKWVKKEASLFSGKTENIFAQVIKKKNDAAWVFCVDHDIYEVDNFCFAHRELITNMFLLNINGTWYQTYGERKQLMSTGIFDEPDKETFFAPNEYMEAKIAGRYAESGSGDYDYELDYYNVLEGCIIKNYYPFTWIDENGDLYVTYFISNGTTQDVTVTINSLEVVGIVSEFETDYSFTAPAMQNTTYQICIPANKITGSFEKNKWGRYKGVTVSATSTIE